MIQEHMKKSSIGQGDDYTTSCLLDYLSFKKYYELIAIDLTRQRKTRCWSKGNITN